MKKSSAMKVIHQKAVKGCRRESDILVPYSDDSDSGSDYKDKTCHKKQKQPLMTQEEAQHLLGRLVSGEIQQFRESSSTSGRPSYKNANNVCPKSAEYLDTSDLNDDPAERLSGRSMLGRYHHLEKRQSGRNPVEGRQRGRKPDSNSDLVTYSENSDLNEGPSERSRRCTASGRTQPSKKPQFIQKSELNCKRGRETVPNPHVVAYSEKPYWNSTENNESLYFAAANRFREQIQHQYSKEPRYAHKPENRYVSVPDINPYPNLVAYSHNFDFSKGPSERSGLCSASSLNQPTRKLQFDRNPERNFRRDRKSDGVPDSAAYSNYSDLNEDLVNEEKLLDLRVVNRPSKHSFPGGSWHFEKRHTDEKPVENSSCVKNAYPDPNLADVSDDSDLDEDAARKDSPMIADSYSDLAAFSDDSDLDKGPSNNNKSWALGRSREQALLGYKADFSKDADNTNPELTDLSNVSDSGDEFQGQASEETTDPSRTTQSNYLDVSEESSDDFEDEQDQRTPDQPLTTQNKEVFDREYDMSHYVAFTTDTPASPELCSSCGSPVHKRHERLSRSASPEELMDEDDSRSITGRSQHSDQTLPTDGRGAKNVNDSSLMLVDYSIEDSDSDDGIRNRSHGETQDQSLRTETHHLVHSDSGHKTKTKGTSCRKEQSLTTPTDHLMEDSDSDGGIRNRSFGETQDQPQTTQTDHLDGSRSGDEFEDETLEKTPNKSHTSKNEKEEQGTSKRVLAYSEYGLSNKLPEGWVEVSHESGVQVYLHRMTRVCTFSRPYLLGEGSVRHHKVPQTAIPCFFQRKVREQLEQREKEIEEVVKSQKGAETSAHLIAKLQAPDVKTIAQSQLTPDDLFDYAKSVFEFKTITVYRDKASKWRHLKEQKRAEGKINAAAKAALLDSAPEIPQNMKIITIALDVESEKKAVTIDPRAKTSINILSEYFQKVFRSTPRFTDELTSDVETPFKVIVSLMLSENSERVALSVPLKEKIMSFQNLAKSELNPEIGDEVILGEGVGAKKKTAKLRAAAEAASFLIPEIKFDLDGKVISWNEDSGNKTEKDITVDFNQYEITDPRIAELCKSYAQPSPYTVLQECLRRISACSNDEIQIKTKHKNYSSFIEFTMAVGEQKVSVTCSNQQEGTQRASQLMLALLYPDLQNWGDVLRLYGEEPQRVVKDRSKEVTTLQTFVQNGGDKVLSDHNNAILDKLKEEMKATADGLDLQKGLLKEVSASHLPISECDAVLSAVYAEFHRVKREVPEMGI